MILFFIYCYYYNRMLNINAKPYYPKNVSTNNLVLFFNTKTNKAIYIDISKVKNIPSYLVKIQFLS